MATHPVTREHDPIAASMSRADDRVLLNNWLPPQVGVVPVIRIRRRWVNVLWLLPIGFLLAVIGVAAAQASRDLPAVRDFLNRYPGVPPTVRIVSDGFPIWLRMQHFLNLFFMTFIVRAGLQILADHPRLYWKRDCTPGTEWFRFQKEVPTGRIWTAKDDSVTLPGWLGIPGVRHSIGLARWWHFSINLLWTINGVAFYVLLFSTGQWQRLVPTTWEVFPNALIPTVALGGVQITLLLGGTVLVERIFSYEGIGNMAIDAVINRDFPLIQGLILTFAVLFIALNLVVDVLVTLLDPRLRNG